MGSLAKRQGGPWGLVILSPIKLTRETIVDNIKRKPGGMKSCVHPVGQSELCGRRKLPTACHCREPGAVWVLKQAQRDRENSVKPLAKAQVQCAFTI